MIGPNKNQRYLLWLATGTGVLAVAMAVLLALQIGQKKAIEDHHTLRADSVTALVFQFEREFFRLRQALENQIHNDSDPNAEAINARFNIFLSRLSLLRDNPTSALIIYRNEYQKTVPRIDALVVKVEKLLATKPLSKAALQALLQDFDVLNQEVFALSISAAYEMSELIERQESVLLQQNHEIIWLTLGQLVFLLLAAVTMALRQHRQNKERQALEDLTHELREAHFRATSANRGKSQFLANMSHELRTPFNGMLGMLGLLETTELTSAQVDYIKTAKDSANHLLTLLNDILDVSALESGKMTLNPEPVHLEALLHEVDALMHPLATEKNLLFSIVPKTSIPDWVLADATRLKQILFNLINNAVKFTAHGGVTVTILSYSRNNNTGLSFAIQDTGIGMDEQVLSQLFQRFYQVDASVARKFNGTGLGLEISQTLARMMGGSIEVQSTLGKGSVFTLHLPFTTCPAPPPSQPTAQTAHFAPNARTSRPLTTTSPDNQFGLAWANQPKPSGWRVLVAEDHPVNRKFIGILLAKMGCTTTFSENGQIAIETLAREDFDVILMDVHMPIMDGLTATRLIRAMDDPKSRIPIVILTADIMNDAKEQAIYAGVNDFVTKPVQMEQLQTAFERCLGVPGSPADSHLGAQT